MAEEQKHTVEAEPGLIVLALNSGSSSLKFALYQVSSAQSKELLTDTVFIPSQREAMGQIRARLAEALLPTPDVIGHRVVHGGPTLGQHCLIDESILDRIEAAKAFAPLHTPSILSLMHLALEYFPGIPQVACLDTSFHANLPDVARVFPLPKALQLAGIRRYGFHGLSCESIIRQLSDPLPSRVVIAHLGNGVSITAVKDGQSIDTSMGLTPTGGTIMGTRSGDLDPGVLIHLLQTKHYDADMLEELVNRRSGLLGISGIDCDMRQLHDAAISNADARLAIEMFCYSVRKQIVAMIAVLDGVDLIVFTGGIGEHDWRIRARICNGLPWAGILLDEVRNQLSTNPINQATSHCQVQVLTSQEAKQIARIAWELLTRS